MTTEATLPIDTRPSFRRIHAHLLDRIARGEWRPGELMPGENELAREYGVSVGTMRKSLDALQTHNVIERRRGRGTTVRQTTAEQSLFSYFRFRDATSGKLVPPVDRILAHTTALANAAERKALELPLGSTVFRIRRLRSMGGVPFLTDQMTFPQSRFAHFAWPSNDRTSVYRYLEREFGAIIGYVREQLRAVVLNAAEAKLLRQPAASPALEVLRVAYDLGGAALEVRRSVALSSCAVYLSELRSGR